MSESDRTRRTPRTRPDSEDDAIAGHGIADRDTRRPDMNTQPAEQVDAEEPAVRRTRRESAHTGEDDTTVTRTPRGASDDDSPETAPGNVSETGSRSNIPGNTSETGVGTPTAGTRVPRQGPGQMPVGCTKTAGMFVAMSIAILAAVSKMARR